MKRREFFKKTGFGISGILASHFGLASYNKDDRKNTETNDVKAPKINNPGKPFDIETIRQDFPPLKNLTYFNTASYGLITLQVKAAQEAFLEERLQFGFPLEKSHRGVWEVKMEEVRGKLASFIGAKNKEIAFTQCTGCGSNIALNGIDWRRGDNAVIDDLEFDNAFHILNALKKRKGIEVRIARNKNGVVSPDSLEALIDKRTRALAVSHISMVNGFRHNLKKLADLIHAYGGYLVVDSAQGVGGVKINVKDEGVDFLSSNPYKWLNGPNGISFFYIREDLIPLITPDRVGWYSTKGFKSRETKESKPLPEHASRFEYGTLNYEGIYGIDAAIDYANRIGIESIEQRNLKLVHMLRERLQKKRVKFYTPENNKSQILTFFIENGQEFGKKIKEKNISITARGRKKGQVRMSPHFYNNEEDIDIFMHAFSSIYK